MGIGTFLDQLLQDIRYALRGMAANPLFCAMAALSLALGIGANTAIYSFMDAILIRALPVPDPQSLVVANWRSKAFPKIAHSFSGNNFKDPKLGLVNAPFPYPAFELLRDGRIWSSLFAFYRAGRLNLTVHGQADIATGQYVSGEFFSGLGALPTAGWLIDNGDDRIGSVAADLSYGYAQRRFGDAAKAVGQTILINNQPFTVEGVTAREFFGVDPSGATDIYLPLHAAAALDPNAGPDPNKKYSDTNYYWAQIMGRLRPGITRAQAQAVLAPVFHRFVESTATTDKERADLPILLLREGAGGLDSLRRRYSEPLYVILTLVGLILAIACANIANLLLARSAARSREMAVRLSLGAGRMRVVRQLLTESVVLALAGGALGVLFAIWGIQFLTALMANGEDNFTLHADLNWHVLGVTLGLSLLTGLLFGLAPAVQAVRIDLTPALKSARSSAPRASFGRGWRRIGLSRVLVASQVAISVVLLVAAGLFVHTLSNLQSIDLGFNRENVLLFNVNAKQAGYRDEALARFYGDLQEKLGAIPGVRGVSLSHIALVSDSMSSSNFTIPGRPPAGEMSTAVLRIGPAFFATMQIPIVMGRAINRADQSSAAPVAVVSEIFARKFFGGENPIGRKFAFNSGNQQPIEIVGVAKTARYNSLKSDTPPVAYLPYGQDLRPLGGMYYEVRAAGDPLALAGAIRKTVRAANDRIPVTELRTQEATIGKTIQQERIFAKLCSAFAVLALLIAAVGLYGTMAYTVARRTGEIGIRMALGAQSGSVVWLVMREVLIVTAAGLAIGLPVAYTASHLVQSFLFGMTPKDPVTMGLAAGVLVAAAIAAGYGPARRASRISPMNALRQE
jgi:macrolide transport system ATP-binding/permease protein